MLQVGPHSRHLPLGCDRLLLHGDHPPLPRLPPVQVPIIQSLSSPALHTTMTRHNRGLMSDHNIITQGAVRRGQPLDTLHLAFQVQQGVETEAFSKKHEI